jgi:hypothetical protein
MTPEEKQLKAIAQHLEHLQGRIDVLQSSTNAIAGFIVSLVALIPPEKFSDPVVAEAMKTYLNAYANAQRQGGAALSEFPFVPNPSPEE